MAVKMSMRTEFLAAGDRVVHRAVRCLNDLNEVSDAWSDGRRGVRNNSVGLPRQRTRAAVLQAALLVEPGQIDGLLPGSLRGCDRPAPADQIADVVLHEAEHPVPDGNLHPLEEHFDPDHLAGYRAAVDLVNEDRVELRAARGVIHGEPELLTLGVLARVYRPTAPGKGGRPRRKHQQARAEHRQDKVPSHRDPPSPQG